MVSPIYVMCPSDHDIIQLIQVVIADRCQNLRLRNVCNFYEGYQYESDE
jgi:hypothetical protein